MRISGPHEILRWLADDYEAIGNSPTVDTPSRRAQGWAIVLPSLPFVVLDMNACRHEGLVRPLLEAHERDGISIIFPAISHWELTKGSDTTIPQSFAIIQSRPEAVSFARHTYVFKHVELTRRGSRRKRLRMREIVDHTHTSNVRSVLRGLRDDTHVVDPRTREAIRDFWRPILDRENAPGVMRLLVEWCEKHCPQPVANAARAGLSQDPPDRRAFLSALDVCIGGKVQLAKFLRGVGFGSSRAKRLARFPSFSLLHLAGLIAVALRWRVFGGKSSAINAKDQKLENAFIDVEYAVLAAYGQGFVTTEKRDAADAYKGILHIATRVWPRRV